MQALNHAIICLSIILIIVSLINIKMLFKMKKHNHNLRASVYDKYQVITLCGSTRFKDEFEVVNKELTLRGYIVISVGCFGHHGDTESWNYDTKRMLDKIHKRKIDLSSAIMVINKDNYIGESTKAEIAYAKSTNKDVFYWYNN